jgi:hypothetical protein
MPGPGGSHGSGLANAEISPDSRVNEETMMAGPGDALPRAILPILADGDMARQ